jgi:hypothetical protein
MITASANSMSITVRVFPFCYKWNIRSVDRSGLHYTWPNTWPNVRAPPIDFAHTLTAATDARVLLPRFPRRARDL